MTPLGGSHANMVLGPQLMATGIKGNKAAVSHSFSGPALGEWLYFSLLHKQPLLIEYFPSQSGSSGKHNSRKGGPQPH